MSKLCVTLNSHLRLKVKQVTVSYVLNPLFARNQTISVNSKNFKEHVTKGKERLLKNHTNRLLLYLSF